MMPAMSTRPVADPVLERIRALAVACLLALILTALLFPDFVMRQEPLDQPVREAPLPPGPETA